MAREPYKCVICGEFTCEDIDACEDCIHFNQDVVCDDIVKCECSDLDYMRIICKLKDNLINREIELLSLLKQNKDLIKENEYLKQLLNIQLLNVDKGYIDL